MTTTQELLKSSFELNLNNYGPEDVERLNDWAIKAYAALEALRAGGVELTSEMIFWLTDNPNSGDIRDALQDYGDRRVAAAVMTTPKEQTP